VKSLVNQCGILFIGPCGKDDRRLAALRSLGFRVEESEYPPSADVLLNYHAVIVRALPAGALPMVGARLRAKPQFGRRVLIALVADGVSDRDNREALMSGFDLTLSDRCSARDITAQILRLLRGFPEYRCLLRAPNGRRKAA
jgi:hypothetical protein